MVFLAAATTAAAVTLAILATILVTTSAADFRKNHPYTRESEFRCRIHETKQNAGFAAFGPARRRTMVRRVVSFVDSSKA